MQTDIYVATHSFVTGDNEVVTAGLTRVRAGHPIMRGREHAFEVLTVHYDVEQATATPGEPRRRAPQNLTPAPLTPPSSGGRE